MNSQETIINNKGEFNLKLWRKLLLNAAQTIDSNLEVICPFGFEVTGDRSFLSRNLKRFYCYFGAAKQFTEPSNELALQLFDHFNKLLKKIDSEFASKIVLFEIESDSNYKQMLKEKHYQPDYTNKILVIEHRIFKEDLLTDYANYIISTLWGFHDKTLPELQRYTESKSVRCRIFQLYLILEYIFGSTIERLKKEEKILLDKIYNMKGVDISYYFTGKEIQLPSSEDNVLMEFVNDRTEKMIERMFEKNCQEGEIVTTKIKAYNSSRFLTFSMNEGVYYSALSRIKSYYNSFSEF